MKTTAGKKTIAKKNPAKSTRKRGQTIVEVRAAAKALGIPAFQKSKAELIRAIQRAEGNFDCYGTASSGFCDQEGCRWHPDCLEESVKPSK